MAGSIVTGIVVLVIAGFAVFAVVSLRDKDKKAEKKEDLCLYKKHRQGIEVPAREALREL